MPKRHKGIFKIVVKKFQLSQIYNFFNKLDTKMQNNAT